MLPKLMFLLLLVSPGWSESPEPRDTQVAEGGHARLRCILNGRYPCQSFNWMKNTELGQSSVSSCRTNLIGDDRYSISYDVYTNAYTLEIQNVKPEDAGRYFCQAITSRREFHSRTASLTVSRSERPKPKCRVSPLIRNQYARVGTSLRFTCHLPHDYFPTDLTWVSTNNRLSQKQRVEPGGKHTIKWNVNMGDNNSIFSCYAGKNDTDRGEVCSLPPLQVMPALLKPILIEKVQGKNADFPCNIQLQDTTTPIYRWLVQLPNGERQIFNSSSDRYRFKNNGQTFRIKQVGVNDSRIRVWCEIVSEQQQSLTSIEPYTLVVHSPLSVMDTASPIPKTTAKQQTPISLTSLLRADIGNINVSDAQLTVLQTTELPTSRSSKTTTFTDKPANKTILSTNNLFTILNEKRDKEAVKQKEQLADISKLNRKSTNHSSSYSHSKSSPAKTYHFSIFIWTILSLLVILIAVVILLTGVMLNDRRRFTKVPRHDNSKPNFEVVKLNIDVKSIPMENNSKMCSNIPNPRQSSVTYNNQSANRKSEVIYALPFTEQGGIGREDSKPSSSSNYSKVDSTIFTNSLKRFQERVVYARPQQKGGGHFEVTRKPTNK